MASQPLFLTYSFWKFLQPVILSVLSRGRYLWRGCCLALLVSKITHGMAVALWMLPVDSFQGLDWRINEILHACRASLVAFHRPMVWAELCLIYLVQWSIRPNFISAPHLPEMHLSICHHIVRHNQDTALSWPTQVRGSLNTDTNWHNNAELQNLLVTSV